MKIALHFKKNWRKYTVVFISMSDYRAVAFGRDGAFSKL